MKNKAIVTALTVNAIIAAMKFAVALFSGSAAMFSEGIHSAADTMNQIVLLVGKRKAVAPPTAKHPFGYTRATFFASFCVATLLFFIGGAFSLMEAVEKISHVVGGTGEWVTDRNGFFLAAGILVVSVVLEVISLRTALAEVREEQERAGVRTGIREFYRDTSNSSLIVVVTEDFAAVVGLALALAGVVLTLVTGNPLWDAIGGAAIGVLLIAAAFILGREIASLILGEALPPGKIKEIEAIALGAPGVARCGSIKTMAQGNDTVLVEIDVYFRAGGALSGADVLDQVADIKRQVKALLQEEGLYVSACIEALRAEEAEARL
ncbi:MAG: cation diffusion facilitator family transporter [Clostridiales Family XIII bacterium]|nr:cation diffusion facilitator family transporter [Clostridiales Family XIII bacterium]